MTLLRSFLPQGAERKIRDEERKLFRKKSKGLSCVPHLFSIKMTILQVNTNKVLFFIHVQVKMGVWE